MGADEGGDDADLSARLAKLSSSLSGRRQEQERPGGGDEAGASKAAAAWSLGVQVLSEFLAGILVGAFLGWLVDRWFGSAPWGLIALSLVGLAAGFWNVYRIAKRGGGNDPQAG